MSSFENGSSRSLCSSHWFHRRSIFNTDAGGGGHLNKFESTLPFGILCWVGLKMAQWFWGRYLNIVNVSSSLSLFPKKECDPSFEENFPQSRMFGGKFDWKWPSGSGEEDFNFFFLEIHHNLPVRRTWPIIWPTWIPFNKIWFMIASNWSSGSWNVDQYVFLLLCINPSCKKNLKFPLPIVASCQFQLKLFWSKRISKNNDTCFNHFALIPLNVGFVLHL